MKNSIKITGLAMSLLFMFSMASTPASGTVGISGQTIVIFYGNGAYNSDFSNFDAAYNTTNTVRIVDELDFATGLADVDILMLPANDYINATDITAIGTWFATGNKVLWVAGDSDYGGYWIAGELNPVLAEVDSVLRLDAGAIDDAVNNDGASYRVMPTQFGDGPIATAIFNGVTNASMPFHGPTSVYAEVAGTGTDLRTTDVTNVEVIISASVNATVLDQDVSLGADDFYFGTGVKGSFPLMAVEAMDNGNTVIVTGESIFANYKFMYGDNWEQSGLPHEGKKITDNTLTYGVGEFVTETTTTTTTTPPTTTTTTTPTDDSSSDDSPFDMTFFALSFGVIAVFVTVKRRK